MSVVHDASSLLAVAFREPGGDVARAALRGSLVSGVNWSEVIQKVQARGRDTKQLAQLYIGLGVTIVPFGLETAERAASLYGETRAFGLSLGDRACLALGLETGREVYTADTRWTEIPFRDQGHGDPLMSDLVYAAHAWKAWSSLGEGERKLRAAKAIQQEDHDDLWLMTLAYLQFKGRKGTSISSHTLRAYRRGVVDYLIYRGGSDILRVSPDEAQTYVRILEQGSDEVKPKSPATVQLRSVAARRFYQALAWCGFELDNPFEKVMIKPDPVKPHEKRSEYGLDTVKELVRACDTFDDPIAKVAILLAVLSGLRIEEIATLEWGDIDFRERLIRVRGKGKKTRLVPLDTVIGKALSEVPHTGKQVLMRYYRKNWAPYTTAGLRAKIRQLYLKAFGINPFSQQPNGYKGVHAFRHTFGVIMQEQVGALETQALLGHESLTTTMRYSKVTSRKASERARKAQEALGKSME